jgi:putative membrane protein
MDAPLWLRVFIATVAYTAFGIVVFGLAFWVIVKITPFSIRKEIEDDQNTALAILIGAVILGLAVIIASTVHG